MMAGFMSYFVGGRQDPKQKARDAIIGLRQQLQMIEKKEEYLQKKIDDELKKAKANAVGNKMAAMAALKRKQATEQELDRLTRTRGQIEIQVSTLESANLNAETLAAMTKAADALKVIHNKVTMSTLDKTVMDMTEQMDIAGEIGEALASQIGPQMDEDELKAELEQLQEDELNIRLGDVDHVPVHLPPGTTTRIEEADEEAELKELQAALAM